MKKNTEWMSISDIMSGLMMVFLFITVALLIVKNDEILERKEEINILKNAQQIIDNSDNVKKDLAKLAVKYSRLKSQLNDETAALIELNRENETLKLQIKNIKSKVNVFDSVRRDRIILDINQTLNNEFGKDLDRWSATINSDNSIVFNHPKIYFDSDNSEIRPEFKKILSEFFPRYISIFADTNFGLYIKNIKIEGHTSSVWNYNRLTSGQDQYFNHMELSQERANSVLKYCYKDIPEYDYFLKSKLESSGLSFSQAVMKEDNKEDVSASHRVTFRLIYMDK